jgi:hypothetical protein
VCWRGQPEEFLCHHAPPSLVIDNRRAWRWMQGA